MQQLVRQCWGCFCSQGILRSTLHLTPGIRTIDLIDQPVGQSADFRKRLARIPVDPTPRRRTARPPMRPCRPDTGRHQSEGTRTIARPARNPLNMGVSQTESAGSGRMILPPLRSGPTLETAPSTAPKLPWLSLAPPKTCRHLARHGTVCEPRAAPPALTMRRQRAHHRPAPSSSAGNLRPAGRPLRDRCHSLRPTG